MHKTQEKILSLLHSRGALPLNYAQIARDIEDADGEPQNLQNIKHHLGQLEKKEYLTIDETKKIIREQGREDTRHFSISKIPFYGTANAGRPLAYAEDSIQGYLKISSSIVPFDDDFIAIKAVGNSMNRANAGQEGIPINDGDYAIIDTSEKVPDNGDYIVSVIDDGANIKQFFYDEENRYVVLRSRSTEDIPDIIIHEDDSYSVVGIVEHVVKKPQIRE